MTPLTLRGVLQSGRPCPRQGSNNRNTGLDIGKGASGKLKWKFKVGNGGEVDSSPASGANDTLYFGASILDAGYLCALDGATGVLRWKFQMAGYISSAPVIGGDDTVYFGSCDHYFYALDGNTGRLRWKFQTAGAPSAPVIGGDDTVYFGSDDHYFYALGGNTGVLKWKLNTRGRVESSPVIGADDTVYIANMNYDDKAGESRHMFLYALDGATGAIKWKFHIGGQGDEDSPAIGGDDTVYVGAIRNDFSAGTFYALNTITGAVKWRFKSGGLFVTSPVIGANGIVYIANVYSSDTYKHKYYRKHGYLYAFNGVTGKLEWKFEGLAFSSCVIGADGTVYISDDNGCDSDIGHLYALNGATGKLKWKFKFRGGVAGLAMGADGTVYISDTVADDHVDGHLCAFNGATGKLKWKFKFRSGGAGLAMGADGTVYVRSRDGYLYAIR